MDELASVMRQPLPARYLHITIWFCLVWLVLAQIGSVPNRWVRFGSACIGLYGFACVVLAQLGAVCTLTLFHFA
jgi:hypothetical protein